jgi:AbrB family looped-hinge helix DNA binding protein
VRFSDILTPEVTGMSYIRVRQRNQLTLPKEISAALQVKEGDFLEVSTSENAVILRPARIVKFGTPEGEAAARRGEQSIREGRYKTFEDLETFAQYLGLSTQAATEQEVVDGSVMRWVSEALDEAGGNAKAAAENLARAHRELKTRIEAAPAVAVSK